MTKPSIAQMIAEQRQSLQEIATLAAKGGRDQSKHQYRHQMRQAIMDVLCWCEGNADEIREYRKASDQPPKQKGEE